MISTGSASIQQRRRAVARSRRYSNPTGQAVRTSPAVGFCRSGRSRAPAAQPELLRRQLTIAAFARFRQRARRGSGAQIRELGPPARACTCLPIAEEP